MADVKESCDDNKMDVQDSSGSKDLSKSLPVEAFNNFLQGRRHLVVKDYHNAVVNLTKALEMYVNHFGEMAIECAEVYFLYGKALSRLAQKQSEVLGGAINDGSNEENSSESEGKENESDKNSGDEGEEADENEADENEADENEADENEAEENEAEVNEQENKEEKEPSESTDSPPATVDEGSSEAKVEGNSETTETPKSTEALETSDKEAKEKDTNEPEVSETAGGSKAEESMDENSEAEEDDFGIAWNNLETARSILMRRDTVESQLKIAEILQLLAEINMELDNGAAAVRDLKESLEIQKKHLKPDDRMLAETYCQMGLALMLDHEYHDALENFYTAKKILKLHIENLNNTPVDDADGTFAAADMAATIKEIEDVILDLNLKIEDAEELVSNGKKELEELLMQPGISSPFKEKEEKSTTNKPVSNITHLLKRKKPDEGTSEDSAKRIKMTSVLNGDSKVTAPANTEGSKQ